MGNAKQIVKKIEFKNYGMYIGNQLIKRFKKGSVDYEVIVTMMKLKRFTLEHILNKFKKQKKITLILVIRRVNEICIEYIGHPLVVEDSSVKGYYFINHYIAEKEDGYSSYIINIPKYKEKELIEKFGRYLYTNAPIKTDKFIKF
jgi:hypothetical protein